MARFVYDADTGLMVPGRRIERVRCMPLHMGAPQQALMSYGGTPSLVGTGRVLALDFEGTGGTFVDNSGNALTVTGSGGATQTTAQFKFGSKSLDCVTADYVGVAGNALFSLTTFTVHCWYRCTATTSIDSIFDFGSYISGFSVRANAGSASDIIVYWNSASNSMNPTIFGGSGWPANTWVHIALTRDASNNLRIFIDGVLCGTTAGVTQALSSPAVRVGSVLAGGANAYQTFIDDFVIANNCWWTAAFTPPTSSLAGP